MSSRAAQKKSVAQVSAGPGPVIFLDGSWLCRPVYGSFREKSWGGKAPVSAHLFLRLDQMLDLVIVLQLQVSVPMCRLQERLVVVGVAKKAKRRAII